MKPKKCVLTNLQQKLFENACKNKFKPIFAQTMSKFLKALSQERGVCSSSSSPAISFCVCISKNGMDY